MHAQRIACALATSGLLVLGGCGGGHSPRRPDPVSPAHAATAPGLGEVLAIPAVGRFYGRCDPAARQWSLRFVDDTGVDDLVDYRLGAGRSTHVDVRPSGTIDWKLTPGAAHVTQPRDPISNSPAGTIPSTARLTLEIEQGSEPHIYRIDADLALAAAIGDTADCALVSSSLRALTYFNGGAPAVP